MDKGKGKGKVDDDYYVASGSSTHGKTADKGKEVWEDDAAAAALVDCFSFSGRRRDMSLLLGLMPPQLDDPTSEVLVDHLEILTDGDAAGDTNNLEVQIQVPTQTAKRQSYMDLLLSEDYLDLSSVRENTTSFSPSWTEVPKMSFENNNAIETSELKPPGHDDSHCDHVMSGSSAGSNPQFLGVPVKVEQYNRMTLAMPVHGAGCLPVQSSSRSVPRSFSEQGSQIIVPNKHDVGGLPPMQSASSSSSIELPFLAEVMAVQKACLRAWFDLDQGAARKFMHNSPYALKNHYAPDVETFYRNPTNLSAPRHGRNFNFSQSQHHGGGRLNNMEFESLLHNIKHRANRPMRLINIKGHVPAVSVDPYGSHFIQVKLGIATTGEILMVYKEIVPHVCTLAVDAFANYAIQKLLEHGPPFCRKELVHNLLGHVFSLSFHLFGCRVIQKAFEMSEIDLQIEMAKELCRNLVKCVRDQYANHVVQKCIECVPPHYIQFIYTSLCGKAKMLSSHPYGCRVIQKALEFCKDPQILHVFVSEIIECVNELSAHQFGNYVVQYVVEHGGSNERQRIVLKLAGRVMQMSYQKHSSNVIEKCLLYGSYHDRELIITEIIYAGGGQTADHLLGMMIDQYANYVVQKMIDTADEWQLNVIIDVVRRNLTVLTRYIHGRHVVAQVERLLSTRAGFLVSLAASQFAP